MRTFCFIIVCLLFANTALSQIQPIEVYSSSLKVSGEEHIYLGFEEGDEIIFNFFAKFSQPFDRRFCKHSL